MLVERLILADDDAEREAALEALLAPQREDFVEILRAMDELPATIRLIDPPLHELLPDLTELSVEVALAKERGESDERRERLLGAVAVDARGQPRARAARSAVGRRRARAVRAAGAGDRSGDRAAARRGS